MPIIREGNLPVPHNPTKTPKAQLSDTLYRHSIVSSSNTPIDSLLTHIEGIRWTVDYYSQVLGEDEEPSTFDPSQTQAYQQYLEIKNYELVLQGELNKTTDATDQTMKISGTAITYPYMFPNVGDAFVADIGDGEAAIFTVTSVEKMSLFKRACYEIQFTIAHYMTQALETNLESKVVKHTEFVKDFMTYGQNPVIATVDKLKKDKLEDILSDSLSDWLTEFYSNEYRTILVPTNQQVTYDPFIVRLITTLFDKSEHPILEEISLLNADDQNMNRYIDIWTVLLKREVYMLRTCFDEYFVIPTNKFNRNPFLQTIYWSGIKKVVMPKSENNYTDERLGFTGYTHGEHFSENNLTSKSIKTLPSVATSPTYVFSQKFYENLNGSGLSDLEEYVANYLNYKANDWNDIYNLLKDRRDWDIMQRFYLTPVLLILAISELRGI